MEPAKKPPIAGLSASSFCRRLADTALANPNEAPIATVNRVSSSVQYPHIPHYNLRHTKSRRCATELCEEGASTQVLLGQGVL